MIAVMTSKKKPSRDRHKPGRMVRIREAIAKEYEAMAEVNLTNLTDEIHRALRENLERLGRWPPTQR